MNMELVPPSIRARVSLLVEAFTKGKDEAEVIATEVCQVFESKEAQSDHWFASLRGTARQGFGVANKQLHDGYRVPLDDLITGHDMDRHVEGARRSGETIARWPDYLLAETLRENPTGFDGVSLFHPEHPKVPGNPGRGFYDNDRLAPGDFFDVSREMLARDLGAIDRFAVITSLSTAGVIRDRCRVPDAVRVFPLHGVDDGTWYVVGLPADGRPLLLQVRRPAELRILNSEWSVYVDGDARGAVAPALPQLITRCRISS